MKSQIIPLLAFCLVLPWLVARVFHREDHPDNISNRVERIYPAQSLPLTANFTEGQLVNYDGLSNKQINYLIP